LPLTLGVHGENTPYPSLEPNESDIVNRQSGGEKLKRVLKFYIGGTQHVISRMRNIGNNDTALCLSTWYQRTTSRKWPIVCRMVTWPMTPRDPERSRSRPHYTWDPLF